MKLLLLLPILLPLIACIAISFIKDSKKVLFNGVILLSIVLLFATIVINSCLNDSFVKLISFGKDLNFSFQVDGLSKFFSIAISFVYILITVYSFKYMDKQENLKRFYYFYLSTLSMLISLCYSANLLTMYICFEMVTLCSMPLVLHSLTKESINAAKKYLFYSLGGAFLALFGIVFLTYYSAGDTTFIFGGLEVFKDGNFTGSIQLAHVAIFLLIIGFSCKAGMFPMNGWLPTAHSVAISNSSALLSGVITKAGIIAIIRVIYYIIGPKFILNSWVQYTFLAFACFSILLGSLLAFVEKNLKKRLAYSSVSQLSYILVGVGLLTTSSLNAALIHVITHMLCKVCLFLFAGAVIYKFDKKKVDELNGIGKIMPISTWSFTIASLGLIGIPFTIGFVSKYNLAISSLESSIVAFNYTILIVLFISALLTAAYLLPITFNGFFIKAKGDSNKYNEAKPTLYIPMLILAVLIVVFGIFNQTFIEVISSIINI